MKRIAQAADLYAFIFSLDDFRSGTQFVSESEWPLQVGLMTFPLGHAISAHVHLPQSNPRTQPTQEVLLVVSGKMEVDFFTEDWKPIQTETLNRGCILFQVRGGHAFRFLEPTQLIEVKSGPYQGREKDKVLLNANSSVPSTAAVASCGHNST